MSHTAILILVAIPLIVASSIVVVIRLKQVERRRSQQEYLRRIMPRGEE